MLDELANASVKAAQTIKAACPTSVAFTPTGRLEAMQLRLEAMLQAVDTVRGPIETFYGLLSDEQKARLSAAREASSQQAARGRGLVAQNCTAANTAVQWPGAQIENAVRPTATQQIKLDALKSAAAQAAERLAASCPSELPTTPSARKTRCEFSKRLDVILQEVRNVQIAPK